VWTLEQNLVPTEDNRVHLYLKVFTSNISCCCWKGIGWKPLFSSQQQWLPNSKYMSKIFVCASVPGCKTVCKICAAARLRFSGLGASPAVSSKTFPKRFWGPLDIFSSLIARPKSSVLRCLIRCPVGVRCLEFVPAPGTPDKARNEAGIGGPDASLKRTTPNHLVLLVNRR
jgi:hypothetical protein